MRGLRLYLRLRIHEGGGVMEEIMFKLFFPLYITTLEKGSSGGGGCLRRRGVELIYKPYHTTSYPHSGKGSPGSSHIPTPTQSMCVCLCVLVLHSPQISSNTPRDQHLLSNRSTPICPLSNMSSLNQTPVLSSSLFLFPRLPTLDRHPGSSGRS